MSARLKWSALAVLLMAGCDRVPGTPEAAARSAVSSGLIDPESARFEYLAKTSAAVCGTVNARNRMGGYAGATPFIAPRDGGRVLLYPAAPSIVDYAVWSRNGEDEVGRNAYNRLEDGCVFPERWLSTCGQAWTGPIGDEKVCDAWKRKDFPALIDLREDHYRR